MLYYVYNLYCYCFLMCNGCYQPLCYSIPSYLELYNMPPMKLQHQTKHKCLKKRSETSYLLAKSTANRHRWTKICHAARVDTGILNRTEHERLQKRSKMSHLWFKCSFNHHQWIKICHALTGVSVLVLWSLSAFYFLA